MTAPSPADPVAFRTFELGGWEYAAGAYADHWLSLTSQAVSPLLDAAGVVDGSRVLDVATGPGIVAQAAAERGAVVVGLDFSLNMVGLARAAYPDLEFVCGDAESLPIRPGSQDAVVMSFGMLHLSQPERAMTEAWHALRPGGRFAFTVWAPPDQAIVFGIVLAAIQTHGDPGVALPVGPPFFRFSDPEVARRVLIDTGFAEPTVQVLPMVWRIGSAELLFDAMYHGTARTGGLLRRQLPEAVAQIRALVVEALAPYAGRDGLAVPSPAILASARKP